MADLQALQQFAADNGFDLTRPLTHAQADLLARYWAPDMRFHEDERFHPIALDEVVSMVETHFAALPEQARAQLRVPVTVRRDAQTAEVRTFDPPIVRVPDGVVLGNAPPNQIVAVARVLTDGTSVPDAMALPEVGDAAVLTHGANFGRANAFFGASQTFSGGSVGLPGDPFVMEGLSRQALIAEVKKLRQGIREHRDSTGHELCWHHPALWGMLPDHQDPLPVVPEWPQFLRGCIRYRQSLDEQLHDAPRTATEHWEQE